MSRMNIRCPKNSTIKYESIFGEAPLNQLNNCSEDFTSNCQGQNNCVLYSESLNTCSGFVLDYACVEEIGYPLIELEEEEEMNGEQEEFNGEQEEELHNIIEESTNCNNIIIPENSIFNNKIFKIDPVIINNIVNYISLLTSKYKNMIWILVSVICLFLLLILLLVLIPSRNTRPIIPAIPPIDTSEVIIREIAI